MAIHIFELLEHIFQIQRKFLLRLVLHIPENNDPLLDFLISENEYEISINVVRVPHLGLQ